MLRRAVHQQSAKRARPRAHKRRDESVSSINNSLVEHIRNSITMEEDTANDEELARALSEQFQAEEAALRASSRQNIPVVIGTVENEPYLHQPSSTINSQFMEDELRLSEAFANSSPEEIARRLAQEEEDAALAARLAQQDINFASTGATPHQVPTTEADMQRRRTARRKQSMRSALTCILGK